MKIVFIAPDGLSVVLFCKKILKTLKETLNANVIVICDVGDYNQEIESLGVKCVNIGAYRFFSISEDLKYLCHFAYHSSTHHHKHRYHHMS